MPSVPCSPRRSCLMSEAMARPTLDEVRERLLDAGVNVLQRQLDDPEHQGPIGDIDFKQVAAEAGYRSPGMIYTAWTDMYPGVSGRDAYVHDLTLRLIDLETRPGPSPDTLRDAIPEGITGDDLFKLVANTTFEESVAARSWTAHASLAAIGRGSELHDRYRDLDAEHARAGAFMYEYAMEVSRRRFKPGIDAVTLSVVMRALENGLAASIYLHPDLVPHENLTWRGSDGWSLFAILARELLEGLSERDDAGDDPGSATEDDSD